MKTVIWLSLKCHELADLGFFIIGFSLVTMLEVEIHFSDLTIFLCDSFARKTSRCGRSTKRSVWWCWPTWRCWTSTQKKSTSTAAPSAWATRSVCRAAASSTIWYMRWRLASMALPASATEAVVLRPSSFRSCKTGQHVAPSSWIYLYSVFYKTTHGPNTHASANDAFPTLGSGDSLEPRFRIKSLWYWNGP